MNNPYNSLPPLIPESLIERLSVLSPALLCDGMQKLGIPRNGCMDANLLPIDEHKTMIGTACTVDTQEGDNFPVHVAIYQGAPGYVLVVAGKGYQERAYVGDLMVSAAQAVGFNGVVIDGCIRDKTGLAELTIPVYAKGVMPRSPAKKGPGKINSVVMCAGIDVSPGDLVFGDGDGVVVVPREHIEAVVAEAEKKLEYEIRRREVIEKYSQCRLKQQPLPELAPDWVTRLLKET
ncbi:RraA family protein [Enterobacteriaceae bacterium H11S18]|uniref:RraA family protein n=1 Tax=Dryocola clanedunensis TaxID=2925396 RepID=UPI0022F073AC|nr:RraA family protein [Dryocola clanedunensis]MCT4710298.1 RraA family protein [Dryocola clanedunensis]